MVKNGLKISMFQVLAMLRTSRQRLGNLNSKRAISSENALELMRLSMLLEKMLTCRLPEGPVRRIRGIVERTKGILQKVIH